jgi:predicted amidohydrolase
LAGGRVAGHYTKTMPTGEDWALMGFHDDELPVFEAKGVKFGAIICHDSSFPEVAATLAWKGARLIFSPHYNNLPRNRMDEHRILVRNNHVGIAAHYNIVLARSNVIGYWPKKDSFGYGDSAIFGPNGAALAEAGLFTEKLVTLDVAPYLAGIGWRSRTELRPAIIDELHAAALSALKDARKPRKKK